MNLELAAMRWLRFERRCRVVLFERSPRWAYGSRPDVMGVDNFRRLIEIECKRSMADFRNNQYKRHVVNRSKLLDLWPYQFYFIVPVKLKDRCLAELPDYAGLMTHDGGSFVIVERTAPLNKESPKLSIKECVTLAALMANQICATETRAQASIYNFKDGHEPWGIEYQI